MNGLYWGMWVILFIAVILGFSGEKISKKKKNMI